MIAYFLLKIFAAKAIDFYAMFCYMFSFQYQENYLSFHHKFYISPMFEQSNPMVFHISLVNQIHCALLVLDFNF